MWEYFRVTTAYLCTKAAAVIDALSHHVSHYFKCPFTSLVISYHISAVGGNENYHSSEHCLLIASGVMTFQKFTPILLDSIIQRSSYALLLILIDIPFDIIFLCTCLGQVARRFSGVNNVPALSGILPNSRRMGTEVSPAQQDATLTSIWLWWKGFLL